MNIYTKTLLSGSHPINNRHSLSLSAETDGMRLNLGEISLSDEREPSFAPNLTRTGGEAAAAHVAAIIGEHRDTIVAALADREKGLPVSLRLDLK